MKKNLTCPVESSMSCFVSFIANLCTFHIFSQLNNNPTSKKEKKKKKEKTNKINKQVHKCFNTLSGIRFHACHYYTSQIALLF